MIDTKIESKGVGLLRQDPAKIEAVLGYKVVVARRRLSLELCGHAVLMALVKDYEKRPFLWLAVAFTAFFVAGCCVGALLVSWGRHFVFA